PSRLAPVPYTTLFRPADERQPPALFVLPMAGLAAIADRGEPLAGLLAVGQVARTGVAGGSSQLVGIAGEHLIMFDHLGKRGSHRSEEHTSELQSRANL